MSIGRWAFSNCSELISITVASGNTVYRSEGNCLIQNYNNELLLGCKVSTVIPSSVKSIGNKAFYFCGGLYSITIPDSVTNIGYQAFYRCWGLDSVTIPESVKSIGSEAFSGCSGLTSVTIGSSVTSIGRWAFSGCSGLTSVSIPDSVTSIGSEVFVRCSGLTSVSIPDSVTSIGSEVFAICNSLESITVGSGNTVYRSEGNCLIQIAYNQLIAGCKASVIPSSVTSIGDVAFSYCSSLTSVIIPESVMSIGDYAFYNCSGLTSVTIPKSVMSIGDYAFGGTRLTSVTFEGVIPSSGFSTDAFGNRDFSNYLGDLHDKFYAKDPANGTPGTYTRARPGYDGTWTLQ
jgi:hypothetical protein